MHIGLEADQLAPMFRDKLRGASLNPTLFQNADQTIPVKTNRDRIGHRQRRGGLVAV